MTETLGSVEALLQLLTAYQGKNGFRPKPKEVWEQIAPLLKQSKIAGRHQLEWYFVNDEVPLTPPATFFSDLEDLLRKGLVSIQPDGGLEVTAAGQFFAFARILPAELLPIQKKLGELSTAKTSNHR